MVPLSVGSQEITDSVAVVEDLRPLQKANLQIRGFLGRNFLEHFDVLIDYRHGLLCLDEANVMRPTLKGERIALVSPDKATPSMALIIPAHLSGVGRALLLELDTGATVPLLFEPAKYLAPGLLGHPAMHALSGDGRKRTFGVLSPQNMRIGRLTLNQISFVTLASSGKEAPKFEADGLLTTGLFRSIYICYADRFVILESW